MTTELRHAAPGRRRGAKRLFGGARIALVRLTMFWERLWPVLLPALAPAFLIVVASLFALWRVVPGWAHWAALAIAALATAAAAIRYGRDLRWPTRQQALARLEADGRLKHNPLQSIEDRPFREQPDSPLWRAHLEDMRRRAAGARLRGPRATADARDPFALRYGAIGLLAVALVAAGSERDARLSIALTPGQGLAGAGALADLWIEPPAYTGKAPIFLARAGEPLTGARAQIDAPEGALVIAQINNARRFKLTLQTAADVVVAEPDAAAAGRASLPLKKSGLLRLRLAGAEGRWPIGVIADDPPTVEFIDPPSTTDDARLAIAVYVDDDYGIAGATLRMRLDPDQERPLDGPAFDEASIRDVRVVNLEGVAGLPGERRFDLDLQADPWAGLAVIGEIIVRDGGGNTGATPETSMRLPARPFFNPLARAVIEQRQTLAVAAKDWRRAGRSFDALTLSPENFYDKSTDYLLMRTAFWRVMRQNGEGFAEAVDAFWPLALQLEDEALELARQRLEAAQDALRQALENGASDDEIARLVENLREAMRQYLQALAQSGQRMADGSAPRGEVLNQGDLEQMLDAIRNLAQSGAENAARQALSELENLLNNLRLSSRGGAGSGQGQGQPGEGQGGAAGAAGDLIGRQRDLANQSFERGQTPGGTGDDLAGEEGALAGDLKSLLDALKGGATGTDPSGDGAAALGEALGDMREAESALRRDNFDAAATAMESAIANLRQGAESLAQAEAAQGRQQRGAGEGMAGQGLDPLGRPIGDAYGRGVDVPEDSDAQRSRDVLEELRRRLSDGKRGKDEIDYLERLLDRF